MIHFRFIPIAVAVTAVSALVACNTAPTVPMSGASANSMATPDQLARMDAQMKTMRAMHEKMMSAKSPEERNKLMTEHMKTMQDGMKMMGDMSGAGMGDMAARHQMMEKRMQMMQTMMEMMMDRMPAAPAR